MKAGAQRGRVGALMRTVFVMLVTLAACGGSTQHPPVQEVPIDQGGHTSSELPPDEVGSDAAVTTTTAPMGTGSSTGPQSLDTGAQDAGAQAGFVQRSGGLTEHECTDVVMAFAKLDGKEKHHAAPAQASLAQDATFGPMLVDCGANTTKKQQKCGMTAKTTAVWQKCMTTP
jgi:hypothetical protein